MAESLTAYQQVKRKLRMHLADLLELRTGDDRHKMLDRTIVANQLRQAMETSPAEFKLGTITQDQQQELINEIVDEIAGIGPIEQLVSDSTISEIMVNGPHEIFIERNGKVERIAAQFRDTQHLMSVIERMLGSVHLSINEASPICDASLADGSRINVIIPPLVLNGPVVTIRRKLRDWSMQDYLDKGSLTPEVAEFFSACVKAKVNIVISGGTSTGKTTLVSILSTFIPAEERLITIENVPELELINRKHWIRMVGRQSNMEGRGEVGLRALVKNALRMRPDRIILGEARGGEALDVVQAMHSGHDGFFTVLHANSPAAALERLETLMLMSGLDLPLHACRMQISSAVDLVVHVSRFLDGNRGISSITQLSGLTDGVIQLEELFTLDMVPGKAAGVFSGKLRYTGIKPKFLKKFQLEHIPVPSWLNVS